MCRRKSLRLPNKSKTPFRASATILFYRITIRQNNPVLLKKAKQESGEILFFYKKKARERVVVA
jgi:hypothetical protein